MSDVVIGGTTVRQLACGLTVSILHDGAMAFGVRPQSVSAAQAVAMELGGDIVRGLYELELVHTLLAGWLGLRESPVLRERASPRRMPMAANVFNTEYDAVNAVRRLARLHGVDLGQLSAGGATVRPAGLNVVRIPDWVGEA